MPGKNSIANAAVEEVREDWPLEGQATPTIALARLEEIFDQLKGYRDTFTTSNYFSVVQMDLIESVVLAIVSDDFTQGAQTRRWLDDDEFLVRRRIHDDHRKMVAQT